MRSPCIVLLGLGQSVGLTCARRFVDDKWSVVIVDGNQKNIDRAQRDLGDKCHYLHEDHTTRLGLKNALSGTLERFDGVETVLSIPSIPEDVSLADMSVEYMDTLFQSGGKATLMAAKVFAQEMIREVRIENDDVERPVFDKSFLTILSYAALLSDQGRLGAAISQSTILSVVKSLSVELSEYKIRSNAVVSIRPRAEEEEDWLKQRTPLQRSAKPSEIAEAAFYLSSPKARFITGQSITIDGGRSVLNGVFSVSDT